MNFSYLSVFFLIFLVSLYVDIRAHRESHDVSMSNAIAWTCVWMLVSVCFGGVTWLMLGQEEAMMYLSGWVMEKTLAVDNLFAFIAVFASFGLNTPEKQVYQHRILHYGIIGAIVFRVLCLGVIGGLLQTTGVFKICITLSLAGLVLWSAWKMYEASNSESDDDVDYSNHWSVVYARKMMPVDHELRSNAFFSWKDGKHHATILLLALICVEFVDIAFAFDSMPAVAVVTQRPDLMITASLMAVAGLRSLYFVIQAARAYLDRLDEAVIWLLVYIGLKFVADAFALFHIPGLVNLGVVAAFLIAGVIASIYFPAKEQEAAA